jgi:integrase
LVRDLKSPSGKGVNDSFPLLGRAWDIVQAQPRTSDRIFPYRWKSASISYTTAKNRLGIKGLHLHDNRRDCISRMFEQGYNVPEVAKLSLHRNPTVLLKTYTALKPEDLHRGPASKRAQP